MVQLVALLSTGKGSWAEVAALINKPEFDEIFIITNPFGKEKFTSLPQKKIHVLAFNLDEPDVTILAKNIRIALQNSIHFGDVAVNISSGTGKEHMALLSALFEAGAGIRFVTIKDGWVCEVKAGALPTVVDG